MAEFWGSSPHGLTIYFNNLNLAGPGSVSAIASLESADRIVDRITERFWLVGEHPNAGKPAGNIARGVRCFPAGKYLICYRNTRRGTDILHIFHGARDQRRAFKTLKKRR
jgi:plasmid stabilization system protein ParE